MGEVKNCEYESLPMISNIANKETAIFYSEENPRNINPIDSS